VYDNIITHCVSMYGGYFVISITLSAGWGKASYLLHKGILIILCFVCILETMTYNLVKIIELGSAVPPKKMKKYR
jgi:hypothetical protein